MFCNNCGSANPPASSFCSSCGTKMASTQSHLSSTKSDLDEGFEAEHNAAWDLVDSGGYAQAEKIFRKLCEAGYDNAWLGLGFVLRDTPIDRSSTEYSSVAVKALTSLSSDAEDNEIAVVIGSVVLPLARYTLNAKLLEWAGEENASNKSWPELVTETSPWIEWIMNLVEMVKNTFDSGAISLDVTIYYYETIHRIGELVNEVGQLRDVLEGEAENSYLTRLGRAGFAKFGRWT